MEREQLIDFLIYVDENDLLRKPGMRDEIVDMYLKSINSRLSERRAIGSEPLDAALLPTTTCMSSSR